jgi:hypothetical protein
VDVFMPRQCYSRYLPNEAGWAPELILTFWRRGKLLGACRKFWTKNIKSSSSGFGGLEDACWPLVPKFAGSFPAEAVAFFRAKKSPARRHSEGK